MITPLLLVAYNHPSSRSYLAADRIAVPSIKTTPAETKNRVTGNNPAEATAAVPIAEKKITREVRGKDTLGAECEDETSTVSAEGAIRYRAAWLFIHSGSMTVSLLGSYFPCLQVSWCVERRGRAHCLCKEKEWQLVRLCGTAHK